MKTANYLDLRNQGITHAGYELMDTIISRAALIFQFQQFCDLRILIKRKQARL